MDQVNGDLNDDGRKDKILVLKQRNEITEAEKRPVLILIKQKDGVFKEVARNENIVLSLGDGGIHGDPYHGITIKKDFFSIEHFGGSGWRWNQVITFRYCKYLGGWYLYKIGSESWHIDSPKQLEMSLKTKKDFGEMLFTNYKNKWRDAK